MARKAATSVHGVAGKSKVKKSARVSAVAVGRTKAIKSSAVRAAAAKPAKPLKRRTDRSVAAVGLNGIHHAEPPRSNFASVPWMAPWNEVGRVATRMMMQDAVKSAMERQLQLYQTMARYSPLHMTIQFVQGLLPAPEASQQGDGRRH